MKCSFFFFLPESVFFPQVFLHVQVVPDCQSAVCVYCAYLAQMRHSREGGVGGHGVCTTSRVMSSSASTESRNNTSTRRKHFQEGRVSPLPFQTRPGQARIGQIKLDQTRPN